MHCTLLRAFPEAALEGRVAADVAAVCERWTAQLAGAKVGWCKLTPMLRERDVYDLKLKRDKMLLT